MQLFNWLVDAKISALNVSVEMQIGEYWDLAQGILHANDLQRKRVRTSGKIYQHLRKDLLDGCVMPPIILSLTEDASDAVATIIKNTLKKGTVTAGVKQKLEPTIRDAVANKQLIILDGLQRSYTIGECISEASTLGTLSIFKQKPIRTEIYVGLSKMGILYRMLTLNTGQTPMSFRHQIEILYHDYIDSTALPDNIQVLREVDEGAIRGLGRYKYADVVDMFYAYATGTPQSLGKDVLIAQLKELDFIEDYNRDSTDMLKLLTTYNRFVSHIDTSSKEWHWTEKDSEQFDIARPFGTSVPAIFARVQAMTGFGAECKKLIKAKQIKRISQLNDLIESCAFSGRPADSMRQLVQILNQIGEKAKKIGDAQRAYFQFCFRHLFNKDSPSYRDLSSCWLSAQETYESLF